MPALIAAEATKPHLRAVETGAPYSKSRPFEAEVLVNQKITGAGSSKDVRHIELSIEDSGLAYAPGDSLAVVPENPPALIAEIQELLGFDGSEEVVLRGEKQRLGDALERDLEITAVSLAFLRSWARLSGSSALAELLESEQGVADFVERHQVVDVLRMHPAEVPAQAFVETRRVMLVK